MRGLRQNGGNSGPAAGQQGKGRHHQRRGSLGVRHLLRLLVLLAAQQGFSLVEGKSLSRFILQPAAVVVGTLLAPQAAQAQTPVVPVLSATAGDGQVTLTWTPDSNNNFPPTVGTTFERWHYQQKSGGGNFGSWLGMSTNRATRTHTVTGLTNGTAYTFKVRASYTGSGGGAVSGASNEVTATPTASPGVTISDETLTVTAGATATYTVVLDTDPGAQVVVTPTSTPVAKATVSGALTFTTATNNWSTAKTVTVTGAAAGTATISHTITGYSGVSGSDIDTVDVTVEETIAAPVLTTATSTTSGRINLTWTHAGGSAGALAQGATNFHYWQGAHRLKGATDWTVNEDASPGTGIARRTRRLSLGNTYPSGAVVEVRMRANGNKPDPNSVATIEVTGPWSNTREVTYKNDNLAALTFTGNPLTVTAGSSSTYTVKLSKAYGGVLSVTSGATGKATVDPSSLTFAAATYNTAQTVTVTGVANGSADINHAFRLTGATADAIPDAGSVDVTVKAPPSVTVDPTTLTVNEGGSGAYTVKLNTEPSGNVTVTVAGESGGVTANPKSLVFTTQNYNTAKTVTVSAAADENTTNETATLTHSATGGGYNSVSINSVQVTVTDTTPTLQLSTDPSAVTEGTPISLTVTSDRTLIGTLPVSLTLAARSSSGFTAADIPGTLGPRTFNANFGSSPGGTTGTVSIPTSRDTDATEGAEAYRITLNDAAGYAVGTDVTADGVLNDAAAAISLSVADASAAEGDGAMSFTVTASSAPSTAVTFKYTVTAESGDTATAGSDFTAVTAAAKGSGTIAANAQTTTITVTVVDDNDDESDETFTVTLSEPSGATISDAVATGTITDDDNTPPPIGGGGSGSGSGGGSTPPSVPAAPTGAAGSAASTSAGNGQVTLTWANPGDSTIRKWQVRWREIGSPTGARLELEAASYRPGGNQAQPAQESPSYGPWVDVPNSTASTTSHTVTNLTNGKTYGFRIRAVNTAGRPGAPSAEIRVTLLQPPSRPTGVTATAGDRQVSLAWTGPTDATIIRWQVQQKEGSGSYGPWRDIPNSTASTRSHTVTGLTNGATYGFKIRAVNTAGNGDPSDEVTATPVGQDVVQADKARSQVLAATSRTLLGMATDVLGSRSGGEAPVAVAGSGDSMGEQAMGVVENLLGIGSSELPTSLTLEEVEDRLWSQSFQLSPPSAEESSTGQRGWAFWGAGELRSYRSEEAEGLSSSGNLRTAWLGVDYPFTHRGLAGLALSFSSGQSDYTYRKVDGATDGGRMDTRLTTFYPYGSFQVSQQLRLWAMAGIGWGSQQHQQTGDDAKAEGDLRLQMGVVGFEQTLSPIGEVNLSLAGDAGLVKSTTAWQSGSGLEDLSVSLHRIRLGIDSSFPLAEHTTGYVNVKGRIDGGDLPMNAAELVAGVQYSQARFSGFLQGRQVYAFDGSYAESALTAQLRLTANSDGTGLGWTLQPSYGAGNGDVALAAGPSLWTDQQLESLTGAGAAQQEGQHLEWSSRVGYGIRLQHSELLLTPFTEVRLWQGSSHRIGLGLTVEAASWNLEFSGSTEDSGNASPTGNLQLNFSKRL